MEYFQLTNDVEAVEKLMHEALPRVSENREFFAIPVHEAVAAIQQHAMPPATEYQRPHGLDATRSAPPHVCRRCGHPFERSTAQQFCRSAASEPQADWEPFWAALIKGAEFRAIG